ncbi:MAG: hypothetical protein ABH856_02175 [Patescibacteria group bacterium]|nr:hypothetical protein [Patescibacteria group bacterium]
MIKLIGIKELQTNTKKIREEAARGVRFIVIYRSTPVFEINPIEKNVEFVDDLKSTGLYTDEFIKRIEKTEKDMKEGNTRTFTSTEEFLKSLS